MTNSRYQNREYRIRGALSEEQIERHVEREMDLLDRAFLNHEIDQEQYEAETLSLEKWAREEYRK